MRGFIVVLCVLAAGALVLLARVQVSSDDTAAVAVVASAADDALPAAATRLEAPSPASQDESNREIGTAPIAHAQPASLASSERADESALLFDVVDEQDRPVGGAHVVVELYARIGNVSEPDEMGYSRMPPLKRVQRLESSTDASGRARLALDHDLSLRAQASVSAERAPDLIGIAGVVLVPPLAGVHRVELGATAQVRVHVIDPHGASVAGVELEAGARSELPLEPFAHAVSDANGDARLDRLPRGTYWIRARGPRAGPDSAASIDTLRGVPVTVEVQVESATFARAVSGVVLDEHDQPLSGVSVTFRSIPGGRSATSWTNDEGRFTHSSEPSESVEVSLPPSFDSDEFTPERIEVPFGTGGVVFHRTRVLPMLDVYVRLFDAQDRAAIHGACSIVSLSGRQPDSYHVSGSILRVHCRLRRELILTFRAPEHRALAMTLGDFALRASDERSIDIELARGFDEQVTVRDDDTREPLAGTVFTSLEGLNGVCDADGRIELHGSSWPKSFHVEHDGYFPFDWTPSGTAQFDGEIRLVRTPK